MTTDRTPPKLSNETMDTLTDHLDAIAAIIRNESRDEWGIEHGGHHWSIVQNPRTNYWNLTVTSVGLPRESIVLCGLDPDHGSGVDR